MKRILILLFLWLSRASVVSYGQAIIGMSSTFRLYLLRLLEIPQLVLTGDTVTLTAVVVNTGNATFYGLINVSAKEIQHPGVTCGY